MARPHNGSNVSTRPIETKRKESGAFRDILLATAVLTIPLLLITALLLGLIFKYRVSRNPAQANIFQSSSNEDDSGVYYVDFSATRLTTLASWSSSLAPLLPGFLMTLLFFYVSATVRRDSDGSDVRRLPTPYQLSLMLGMFTGGPSALWEWTKYMFWKRREKTVLVAKLSASLLVVAMLLTYLIWAADTWLHVTTTTILFDQVLETTSSIDNFGRRLSASCSSEVTRIVDSCNINLAATAEYLLSGSEGVKILSNTSETNKIGYTVLGGVQYSYVADKAAQPNTDFSASTFASHASCKAISTDCNLSGQVGAFTPFHCSDSFYGDLTSANANDSTSLSRDDAIKSDFFFDQQLIRRMSSFNVSSNPAYFAIGTIVNKNNNYGGAGGNLLDDPEIVNPVHGGTAFILLCELDIYDMQYISINGTIQSASFSPANGTVTSLFVAPFFVTGFPDLYVETSLQIAGISNTSQQIADKFALSLSQITMGGTAGMLIPSPNAEQQQRTQFLVARVPLAPLFTLVGVNLLLVFFGLVMALIACCSGPRRNNGVRKRLTLQGVVASLFEDGSNGGELFGEARGAGGSRVGMGLNEPGEWDYQALSTGH